MRYGPIAETPIDELLLALPDAPIALLDTFLPVVQAQAIMTALRLGVFEGLRSEGQTATQLAASLRVDAETLALVLRVLESAGHVVREGTRYTLSARTRHTLLTDAPARVTAYVALNAMKWDWMARLDEVVRTGRGLDQHQVLIHDPARWATYQAAMLEVARRTAPLVAELVPIRPGARRLLDIAGSHGLYAALLCRKHAPMRADVLDLPQAVREAQPLAQAEGIDDVLTYRPGDALTDDLGRDYDAVFIGNLLHHFNPDQCRSLLARARRALVSDGTVAIWEIRRPAPTDAPELFGDAFALFFRVTSTARCYTEQEYVDWLHEAGFVAVTVQPTAFAPGQILVTARVP